MNIHFNDISAENYYEKLVSATAAVGKTEQSSYQRSGLHQMKDTASTSSLARLASGVLQRMKEEGESFRQDKVDRFKGMADDGVDLKAALGSDEIADGIFARMFG